MTAATAPWRLDGQWSAPARPGVAAAMWRAARSGGNDSSLHLLGRRARRLAAGAAAALAPLAGPAAGPPVFCGSRQEGLLQASWSLMRAAPGPRPTACLSAEPAFDRAAWALARAGLRVVRPLTWLAPAAARAWPSPPPAAGVLALPAACPATGAWDVRLLWQAWAGRRGIEVVLDLSVLAGPPPPMWRGEVDAAAEVLAAGALGGPCGVAVMWPRRGVAMQPLWPGGGQQDGRRAGTVPTVLVAGLAAAARSAAAAAERRPASAAASRDACEAAARALGAVVPTTALRLPHLTALVWPRAAVDRLAAAAAACRLRPQAVEPTPAGARLRLCWSWGARRPGATAWRRRLGRLAAALGAP